MNSVIQNSISMTLAQSKYKIKSAVDSKTSRIANIERLRILSAFAVASFHAHEWFPRSIGVIGFNILLLSFCIFVVNREQPFSLGFIARRKAERLLKPWLFWSVVYGGFKLIKVIHMGVPFSDVFSVTMLLTGTRIHLWFLPFAFLVALLLVIIHRGVVNNSNIFNIVMAAFVGMLCIFGCAVIQSNIQPPVPLGQWTLGLPAIPLGFAIGRIMCVRKNKDRRNLYMLVVFMTALAFVVCMVFDRLQKGIWFDGSSMFAFRYMVSMTLVCLALYWRGNLDIVSKKFASLSYGIYLIHPLVATFLYNFQMAVENPLLLLIFLLLLSSVIILVFKKTPLKQFV